MIQQNNTKLASIASRSTAAQTSTVTKSTATETSDPAADGRSLQQWALHSREVLAELHKMQHSIQQTLEQSPDPSRRPTARSPIGRRSWRSAKSQKPRRAQTKDLVSRFNGETSTRNSGVNLETGSEDCWTRIFSWSEYTACSETRV